MPHPHPLLIPATLLALTAGVFVPAPAAEAGALNEKWVSTDANWVVHIDMDAMRDSTIGSRLLEHPEEFSTDFSGLDEFTAETGIDLRTDVFGITMYGTARDIEKNGVVIAVTNESVDETIALFGEREDVESTTIERKGYTLHEYRGDGDDLFVHVRRTNRANRRVLVVGGDPETLVDALQVIDGDAPNLTARSGPREQRESRRSWSGPMKGSILFVTVHDVDEVPELKPVSEVIQLCEAISIDIGERDGTCRALASVYAADEDDAESITQVVQGLLALGRLIASDDPAMAPLEDVVDALSIKSKGRRITVKVEIESKLLLEEMEAEGH